jgi:hypothetical protein
MLQIFSKSTHNMFFTGHYNERTTSIEISELSLAASIRILMKILIKPERRNFKDVSRAAAESSRHT